MLGGLVLLHTTFPVFSSSQSGNLNLNWCAAVVVVVVVSFFLFFRSLDKEREETPFFIHCAN